MDLITAAKLNPFFWLELDLDPKFGLTWVGLTLRVEKWVKMGRFDLRGFKFWFNNVLNQPKLT